MSNYLIEYRACAAIGHNWNFGSGWALHSDTTMPRDQQTGWRRDCFRCGAWEWKHQLDWEPAARTAAADREHRTGEGNRDE